MAEITQQLVAGVITATNENAGVYTPLTGASISYTPTSTDHRAIIQITGRASMTNSVTQPFYYKIVSTVGGTPTVLAETVSTLGSYINATTETSRGALHAIAYLVPASTSVHTITVEIKIGGASGGSVSGNPEAELSLIEIEPHQRT